MGFPDLISSGMSRCSPASKEWTEPLSTNATSSFDAIFDDPQSIVAIFKQARGFTVFAAFDTGQGVDVSYAIKCIDVPAVPSPLEPLIISRCPRHLQISDSRKLHVVVSTKSGLCLATKCWNQVVKPLLNAVQSLSSTTHKGQYSLLITENAESIKSFAAKTLRAEESAQTVLLMSGDGGTVDLINAMNQDEKQPSPTTIAILPLGTGNALFHSIHRPLYSNSTESALILGLRTLIHGTPVSLPLFRADFSPGARIVTFVQSQNNMTSRPVEYLYGSIVASHGFHASIVYESDTPEYRKHGDKRFGMVANELLELNHAYKATVEVKRPGHSGFRSLGGNEFNYILSTLVSNLERTFTISPDSRPCDGKFRVVTFAPLSKDKAMEIMMAAYNNGAHVSMPEVTYEEIKELKVSVHEPDDRWRKFCIDGTIVAVQEGGWMKVKALSTSPFQVLTTPSI